MKTSSPARLEGKFLHPIYAPHGEIEGVMIASRVGPVQVVFERHDEDPALIFQGLTLGQVVVIDSRPKPPSPKGEAEHPVHVFISLVSVDGAPTPQRQFPPEGPAYRGNVVRLNYARHGERNGVVLDSGDFIHTKPQGMAQLDLKPGDRVEADGDATRLADDTGWAVEATVVNGRPMKAR